MDHLLGSLLDTLGSCDGWLRSQIWLSHFKSTFCVGVTITVIKVEIDKQLQNLKGFQGPKAYLW